MTKTTTTPMMKSTRWPTSATKTNPGVHGAGTIGGHTPGCAVRLTTVEQVCGSVWLRFVAVFLPIIVERLPRRGQGVGLYCFFFVSTPPGSRFFGPLPRTWRRGPVIRGPIVIKRRGPKSINAGDFNRRVAFAFRVAGAELGHLDWVRRARRGRGCR